MRQMRLGLERTVFGEDIQEENGPEHSLAASPGSSEDTGQVTSLLTPSPENRASSEQRTAGLNWLSPIACLCNRSTTYWRPVKQWGKPTVLKVQQVPQPQSQDLP